MSLVCMYGGIQQLRGKVEVGGWSAKFHAYPPTRVGGGSLNVCVDQKLIHLI